MTTIEVTEVGGVRLLQFHRPVLSVSVLDELASRLDELLTGARRLPVVLVSTHPRIFLAGAHLDEIAALDRRTAGGYADRGRAVLHRLEMAPGPTVAAVDGACSGGGFDLAMACDATVVSPRGFLRHPGVVRGLVTGWSGTTRLPWAAGRPRARAAALTAAEMRGADAVRAGLAQVVADEPFRAACGLARSLAELHPSRLGHWRRLRHGRFVDSFRASVVHSC